MKKLLSIIILVLVLCQAGALGVLADDTDIYGTTSISLNPNILIIFDTSGSMSTADVPGELYNPAITYTGTKTSNAVYRKQGGAYSLFTNSVNNIVCADIKNALQTTGHVNQKINNSYDCGGSKKDLYLGNWINYDVAGYGDPATRISVAKRAIKDLINNTDNVRFGLMRFNQNTNDSNSGGRIVKEIGASKAELITAIDGLTASGNTPLAESTAEAGLYFAGKASWFNDGVTYTSPIEERCQKNYIILMTDGEPTSDDDAKLRTGIYINGDKIADYDKDGQSGKLDDVTKYLYNNDMRLDLGEEGESFQTQNVITYTIGFKNSQTLLQDAAANGGGQYYTTNSASGLSAAFEDILASIADVNAVFVSPVVPVSRMNRTYAGDSIYVGFFKPDTSGSWSGNIKKYGLNAHGDIIDALGVDATSEEGAFKSNSRSFWSDAADGPNVLLGGAGGVVLEQASRNLYTYIETEANADLTQSVNAFSKSNAKITAAILDVADSVARDKVIDNIHGVDKAWKLGDILHSQPSVIHYDTNDDDVLDEAYIFVGSNDGMMHCFIDSTGEEKWGFIPPDQLDRLKLLSDAIDVHEIFVDGSPVVYQPKKAGDPANNILFFGERRGGKNYYAIDITSPESPIWLYKIEPNLLGGGAAQLGQSWSTPTIAEIRTGPGTTESDVCKVFLMAGGYDANQDLDSPVATDTTGKAVFAVKVTNGVISNLNKNGANYAGMTNCIVDAAGFDIHGYGVVNRVYAGDLGGKMFAFEDNFYNEAYDKLAVKPVGYDKKYVWGNGTWSARTLFSASADDGVQRKIFYSPDAVAESYGEMIFFGTGDREHPNNVTVVNRIYAVKNDWADPAITLTESDLYDVTDNLIVMGDETQRETAQAGLKSSKGWYIRLNEHLGEKVTSSVIVYAGVAYFTTYTPESGAVVEDDPCEASSGKGQARLYALDYLTGNAAIDFKVEKDLDGNVIHKKEKNDQSIIIGTSIASSPVIAILPGGAKLFVGVEGGVADKDPVPVADLSLFYWRQL